MMEHEEVNDSESELLYGDESQIQIHESDSVCLLKSVPEKESLKWNLEKERERYDEIIEYIHQVDEILNFIKPFPRDEGFGKPTETSSFISETQHKRNGLDHLENILKLVEQLKELQESNFKYGERTCYLKDLKKLREHKKRLKDEEQQYRSAARIRTSSTPENSEFCFSNRKNSSTSEKFEQEPKVTWQNKRKSICLGENRSKVSKWTKVKEAFHWEKTSLEPTNKSESVSEENRTAELESRDQSPDDGSSVSLDVFPPPPPPPPPFPPTPPPPLHLPSVPPRLPLPEDLLTVHPVQTSPSSSSSDKADEFFPGMKENKGKERYSPSYAFDPDDLEEQDLLIRKSSCEEMGQNPQCKEELGCSRSGKSNKTTWSKVKDIIQTRKDSLQKKPKKRGSDEFKKRRKLSTVSNPHFSDQFEDVSSPEEKMKSAEIIPRTAYEFPETPVITEVKCTKKLTPALTVTLPSTEELRSISAEDSDKKVVVEEERPNVLSQFSCQAQYCEDKTKCGKIKSGSNQRLSRWIKVKNVFLTSTSPTRPPPYLPVTSSSPTTQNKSSGFFSDMESDDLSSGEWIDDKSPSQEKQKVGFPEPMTIIQEDIRKSYNELQKKLSQEFDQKLREWEMKCEKNTRQEEFSPKVKGDDSDSIPKFRNARDSITVPLPSINDLSPEFKKKLNDWKKMKTSQSSSSMSSSTTKEEMQGQNIKIRIGEWQPWKTRCGKAGAKGELEDCSRKSEEAQKGSLGRKKDDDAPSIDTNQRGSKKRDSLRKISHSRTSSGGENLMNATPTDKDGRFIKRSQKVKDFQWVEKELQKIEREKLRLEQEREKYLEREARLEKMKKTMGTASPSQEILVKTPEGFFRFKGISQKFTKKLYEWEKAKGIAPEASTFALIEESTLTGPNGNGEIDNLLIQRSKSTGSVPELSTTLLIQSLAHHPSSLSLNDVDELKNRDDVNESVSSNQIKDEPEAVIVEVEDVIEETALLADAPTVECQTPVYSYASEEIDRLMTTSGMILDEKSSKNAAVNVFNTEKDYRDAKTKLDTETKILEKLRSSILTDKGTVEVKHLKSCQAVKAFEEPPLLQELKQPKNEDIPDMRMEKSDTNFTVTSIPVTVLEKSSSQRNFTQHIGRPDRHLFTEKYEKDLSQDFTHTRCDSEVLKRKIKEKITLVERMSTGASWSYSDFAHKTAFTKEEEQRSTKTGEPQDSVQKSESVSVFVPTSRKIISPVKTTKGATPLVYSYVIDDVKSEAQEQSIDQSGRSTLLDQEPCLADSKSVLQNKVEIEGTKRNIGIPPLPNSPKFQKKVNTKDTAPSIRLIIAKYNQKISEHDTTEGKRNEGGSPVWRSPVFGRRMQEKVERFCSRESGERRPSGEVQKSSSLGNMRTSNESSSAFIPAHETKGILKSSSAGIMKIRSTQEATPPPVKLDATKETTPSMLRALKIQKAKEAFLSGRAPGSSDMSTTLTDDPSPSSDIQSDGEQKAESEEGLTKSVSAETITGESSHSSKIEDGQPLQKSSSKFDISSIKSKFRKIRMRKDKEQKMNAVAVLCRQSLFIEVPKSPESAVLSRSCPSSPVMDRSRQEKPKRLPGK